MKPDYNRRQLLYLCFVIFLAPAVRLIPATTASAAGSASWLSPLLALPISLAYLLFLTEFMKNRRTGEGAGELMLRFGGPVVGPAALVLTAAFLFFYCGFLLHSGASRFTSTIYPAATPQPFIYTALVIGTVAALGPMKAIVRSAKIFALLIIAVLLIVVLLAIDSLSLERLLPIIPEKPSALLKSTLPVTDVLTGAVVYTAFAEFGAPVYSGRFRAYARWMLLCAVLLSLMTAAIVGSYGATLTAELAYSFFTLTRGISLFGSLERVEAFIVAIWLFPDFITFALMAASGMRCLQLAFGYRPSADPKRRSSFKNGRWLIFPGIAATLATTFFIPSDAESLKVLSEVVVPILNAGVLLLILPLCYVTGRLKKAQK